MAKAIIYDEIVAAYEYCNLHGLWKAEVQSHGKSLKCVAQTQALLSVFLIRGLVFFIVDNEFWGSFAEQHAFSSLLLSFAGQLLRQNSSTVMTE